MEDITKKATDPIQPIGVAGAFVPPTKPPEVVASGAAANVDPQKRGLFPLKAPMPGGGTSIFAHWAAAAPSPEGAAPYMGEGMPSGPVVGGAPAVTPAAIPTTTMPAVAPTTPAPIEGGQERTFQAPAPIEGAQERTFQAGPGTPVVEGTPTAGVPNPNPVVGTVTRNGKTYQINANGDLPDMGRVSGSGYVGPAGAPVGPVDSNGNGTTRTAELKAQLQEQRADQDRTNDLNQQSLDATQATVAANDAKRAQWEQEVAASSIMNRAPTGAFGTPAQLQFQASMANLQQQGKTAAMQHQGMIRGQDVQAATATRGQNVQARGQDVQARGQDVNAATAAQGHQVQLHGQNLQAGTQLATNANTNETSALNNMNTNTTSARNTDVNSAAHIKAAEVTAKANAEHYRMAAEGWKSSSTMPGQYYRTAPNGEIQFYDFAAVGSAGKGAPKKAA